MKVDFNMKILVGDDVNHAIQGNEYWERIDFHIHVWTPELVST